MIFEINTYREDREDHRPGRGVIFQHREHCMTRRRDGLKIFFLIFDILIVFCFFTANLHAEKLKTLIISGQSWDVFTNHDGSGLYHDLIKEIFDGYTIRHIYVPTVQANTMVANGRADIKMCETKEVESLVLAKQPMYENSFYALYIKAKQHPAETLSIQDKRLVWRTGYYSLEDFTVPFTFTEVRSGTSALEMVINDRADFYIDDLALIQQSFTELGRTFDPQIFALEVVGSRKYYPVFADTERGNILRTHYEQKIKRLMKEGRLQHIYEHYGFRPPRFQ